MKLLQFQYKYITYCKFHCYCKDWVEQLNFLPSIWKEQHYRPVIMKWNEILPANLGLHQVHRREVSIQSPKWHKMEIQHHRRITSASVSRLWYSDSVVKENCCLKTSLLPFLIKLMYVSIPSPAVLSILQQPKRRCLGYSAVCYFSRCSYYRFIALCHWRLITTGPFVFCIVLIPIWGQQNPHIMREMSPVCSGKSRQIFIQWHIIFVSFLLH